jgi:hypothetical protein
LQDVLTSVTLRDKENEFGKPQLRQVKSVDIGAANLSDRLEHLKHNSEKWKTRVGELKMNGHKLNFR